MVLWSAVPTSRPRRASLTGEPMRTEAQELAQELPMTETTDRQAGSHRRRGRPLGMTPEEVLRNIRSLAASGQLFRVHLDHPALYARARRQFGSWADAVANAGFDYLGALAEARRRSVATRRRRRTVAVAR
jgi:hypothetical protein